jgi:hypothetical protein
MRIGIDVAKAELVLATRPTSERWTVGNPSWYQVGQPGMRGAPSACESKGPSAGGDRIGREAPGRRAAQRRRMSGVTPGRPRWR